MQETEPPGTDECAPSTEFEMAFGFEEIGDKPLEDAHKIVLDQNDKLVRGEVSTREFERSVSFNVYVLYRKLMATSSCRSVVADWLLRANVKVKRSATMRSKLCRAIWGPDNERRAADDANVIELADRYFDMGVPSRAEYLAWIDECGGLNAIRRGRISVALGGKASGGKGKALTASDRIEARRKELEESAELASIPLVPKGAADGELVIFTGIVVGASTSLRLAARPEGDGAESKSLHQLPSVTVMRDGVPFRPLKQIPHGMGPRVELLCAEVPPSADELVTHAADAAV